MQNLGEKLKELRLSKNLTLKQVADDIGLTRNAISNYEANIREPSLSVLKSLCDFFDVSADYLIGRSDY
jgi:transcriptional regulator with XRE-family HTH domain